MLGFVCEVTPRCNLNCVFCYNTWRDPQCEQPELLNHHLYADIIAKTVIDAQAQWLAFAGGEPLMHSKLVELAQEVRAKTQKALPHLKMGLSSNGTMLSASKLAELVDAGIEYVELSLFAASKTRYEALTGKNMLEKAHAAILNVKAQHLPLTIACTVLADSMQEFETIALTAVALGADALAVNPFTPTGYGQSNRDGLELSEESLKSFLSMANRIAKEIPIPLHVTLPIEDCVYPHSNYPHLYFSGCQCGTKKWVIDPQGYLRTCEQNEQRIGNLATHTFNELSQNAVVQCFREQNKMTACLQCSQYEYCGGACRFR